MYFSIFLIKLCILTYNITYLHSSLWRQGIKISVDQVYVDPTQRNCFKKIQGNLKRECSYNLENIKPFGIANSVVFSPLQ